jgi:hypothetical protein
MPRPAGPGDHRDQGAQFRPVGHGSPPGAYLAWIMAWKINLSTGVCNDEQPSWGEIWQTAPVVKHGHALPHTAYSSELGNEKAYLLADVPSHLFNDSQVEW